LLPTGIGTAEAFGTAQVNLNVTANAIGSAEAFGTAQLNLVVTPSGIASAETFGAAQLNLNVTASGVVSAEAFGTATLTLGPVTISPVGIASAEVFGATRVGLQVQYVFPAGIVPAEAFGGPAVVKTPAWRLVAPILYERMVERGIRIPRRTALTVFGDDVLLIARETPSNGDLAGKPHVFYGGYEYITFDAILKDLWVNSGFEVEDV